MILDWIGYDLDTIHDKFLQRKTILLFIKEISYQFIEDACK
jgi:hypothetical protein